jgi:hypothetical protein
MATRIANPDLENFLRCANQAQYIGTVNTVQYGALKISLISVAGL